MRKYEETTFYDSTGKPIAYLSDDNTHIYLFNGKAVAYLYDEAVYSYNGKQLGWFEEGWVRDLNGHCVFFTEITNGVGPIKPIKKIKPIKNIKNIKPIKNIRQIKRIKAIKSLSWSNLSRENFFNLK